MLLRNSEYVLFDKGEEPNHSHLSFLINSKIFASPIDKSNMTCQIKPSIFWLKKQTQQLWLHNRVSQMKYSKVRICFCYLLSPKQLITRRHTTNRTNIGTRSCKLSLKRAFTGRSQMMMTNKP